MNFWKNKKVLVAGGAGFIGSHLIERLVDKGAKVRVVDNLENSSLENLGRVKDKISNHRFHRFYGLFLNLFNPLAP